MIGYILQIIFKKVFWSLLTASALISVSQQTPQQATSSAQVLYISHYLEPGMSGPEVTLLQEALMSDQTLYFKIANPGFFGPRTSRALKAFQEEYSLTPDGAVGTDTQAYLNKILERGAATSTSLHDIQAISDAIKNSTSSEMQVLIEFTSSPNQQQIDRVTALGGTVKRVYHLVPAIAATLPKETLIALFEQPDVKTIELDKNAFKRLDFDALQASASVSTTTIPAQPLATDTVSIGIIDTGIDYTHPDLNLQYAGGYNFVSNNDDPMDDNGHGTHVAGIISQVVNTYTAHGATSAHIKLYALKVLDEHGHGYFSDIIAALEWAVDHHLNITNNSFGTSDDPGTIVAEAYNNTDIAKVLSIAAAGNTGTCPGLTDTVEFPARYPSVVAVAAVDNNELRPCFSSTGPYVEIAAPGVSVRSAKLGGGYINLSGTSMASPYISGAAATLLLEGVPDVRHNGRFGDNIRIFLEQAADDVGPSGRDTWYGFGVANISKTLALIASSTQK